MTPWFFQCHLFSMQIKVFYFLPIRLKKYLNYILRKQNQIKSYYIIM